MENSYGVYIGADLEVVVTEKYTMTFRRHGEEDYLESMLLLTKDLTCLGVCHSSPCCTEMRIPPKTWAYAFKMNPIEDLVCNDDNLAALLGRQTVWLDFTAEGSNAKFYDSSVYSSQLAETFTMEELAPACVAAGHDNIAHCLKSWNIGITKLIYKEKPIGVTINTDKHMYIFEITPGSIYCRAARYLVCERGVVFNQNFRQGYEAYMIADNREARDSLTYDPDLFNATECNWIDRSVYWSVASVEQDLIVLHGCQGDTYTWKKPDR